jgi:hypothetical protein
LGWQPKQLHHLDNPIAEDELLAVIKEAPVGKAPIPDGFIGMFFKLCWPIIKADLLQAISFFMSRNQQNLHLLNQTYVVLIPKNSSPQRVVEYMPISLTHSFAKPVSKVLANRLGHELKHIISYRQTSFIKKRCLHDRFMYVQEVSKALHRKKISALFIKLDISKAFDTVNWPYLLCIMKHLGFGSNWINWISTLWCTSSSAFMLNGEPGNKILHCRGVR